MAFLSTTIKIYLNFFENILLYESVKITGFVFFSRSDHCDLWFPIILINITKINRVD